MKKFGKYFYFPTFFCIFVNVRQFFSISKTIYIMKHQQDNNQPPPMPCCSVTYQLWLNQQKTSKK